MNGQAAAYSSFRRIRESVTVSPAKIACQTETNAATASLAAQSSELEALVYYAASCAHFASELKNGFAPAGGSTSPVRAALKVTI